MAGTDTLTTAHTGSFISGQPCHTRAHRGNVFDCLLDLRLINEVSTPAVRTNTEFDLRVLIDLIGLVTEDSWMPPLASGALWRRDALLFRYPERSSLPECGAMSSFERLF